MSDSYYYYLQCESEVKSLKQTVSQDKESLIKEQQEK